MPRLARRSVDPSWRGRITHQRVDDHGELRAAPRFDQLGRFPAGHGADNAGQVPSIDLGDDRRTDAVIVAVAVAHPDEGNPVGHRRSIVSRRKWAAQEMHGS